MYISPPSQMTLHKAKSIFRVVVLLKDSNLMLGRHTPTGMLRPHPGAMPAIFPEAEDRHRCLTACNEVSTDMIERENKRGHKNLGLLDTLGPSEHRPASTLRHRRASHCQAPSGASMGKRWCSRMISMVALVLRDQRAHGGWHVLAMVWPVS